MHVANSGSVYICLCYLFLSHVLSGPPGQPILPVINKLVPYQPFFHTDVSSQVRLGIQSGLSAELELETSIERTLGT